MNAADLTIHVRTGTGSGRTRLSAFDAALRDAGVADFNLIVLSSVIPRGAKVVVGGDGPIAGGYGDRLYVVMATETADEPGTAAWAGLGWVQDGGDRRGLFVEHHGDDEAAVRRQISWSLADLRAHRPLTDTEDRSACVGVPCTDRPVCAVAVAVYGSRGWDV